MKTNRFLLFILCLVLLPGCSLLSRGGYTAWKYEKPNFRISGNAVSIWQTEYYSNKLVISFTADKTENLRVDQYYDEEHESLKSNFSYSYEDGRLTIWGRKASSKDWPHI